MVRRCHDAVRDDEECKLVAVRLIRHRLTLVVSFSVSVDNVWAILTSSVSTVPTGFGADVTMDMSEWIVVAGGGKKKIMMDGIEKEEDRRMSDRFQVCQFARVGIVHLG